MTTFQEPQPQSRRAVRQNERADPSDPAVVVAPYPADSFTASPVQGAPQPVAPPAAGRRSADFTADVAPQIAAEPLNYATQSRPAVAPQGSPQFTVTEPASAAYPVAAPSMDQSQFRVRDFSPESRRAAPEAQPIWAPPPPMPPADLQYRTEAQTPANPAPQYGAPANSALLAPNLEQTLTRRELRAIQHAEEDAAAQATGASGAYAPSSSTITAPPYQQPPSLVAPPQQPFGDRAPAPTTTSSLEAAMAEFDALSRATLQPVQQPAPAPATSSLPAGHWSTQLELDDDTQPHESTINRTVGSGTSATNALVLPTAPLGNDIRGPLTGTGEILLTGSIDLPLAFSSTGATAQIEHESMDALFDMHDAETVNTDSAPVRAISAVSTHTTGTGIIHARKPKGTRGLTLLLVAATVMAVLVAGLLIAAFALNIF